MPKYKRIASTRKQQVEISLNAKGWKDDRTQIRITGPLNIKEVDYNKKSEWETIYDGDVLALKVIKNKENNSEVAILIWKPTNDFIAFNTDERRNLKRLKKDSYYVYLQLVRFLKIFKHESGNVNVVYSSSNKEVKKKKDIIVKDKEGNITYRRVGNMEFVDEGWRRIE